MWKGSKNGVGITKRALSNGNRRPLGKCDLCTQIGWNMTFWLLILTKTSRTPGRNLRYLLDPCPKITCDSLSTYQTPTLKQLMNPYRQTFPEESKHNSLIMSNLNILWATLTSLWLFVSISSWLSLPWSSPLGLPEVCVSQIIILKTPNKLFSFFFFRSLSFF